MSKIVETAFWEFTKRFMQDLPGLTRGLNEASQDLQKTIKGLQEVLRRTSQGPLGLQEVYPGNPPIVHKSFTRGLPRFTKGPPMAYKRFMQWPTGFTNLHCVHWLRFDQHYLQYLVFLHDLHYWYCLTLKTHLNNYLFIWLVCFWGCLGGSCMDLCGVVLGIRGQKRIKKSKKKRIDENMLCFISYVV